MSKFLIVLLCAGLEPGFAATRMLRTPTVSETQSHSRMRITSGPRGAREGRRGGSPASRARPRIPNFSPDGKWLAFSAEYAGNADVYVVPAEGGEPKRLTWHPGADVVQGWTRDGKSILFTPTRATWAPSGAPALLDGAGDRAAWRTPIALPRGYQGKFSADGTHIAYRMNNSWDEERRNYRGGQNRPIWIVDLKSYDLVSPPWNGSKDMDPAWVGETVYFISDRDGVANIWTTTRERRSWPRPRTSPTST